MSGMIGVPILPMGSASPEERITRQTLEQEAEFQRLRQDVQQIKAERLVAGAREADQKQLTDTLIQITSASFDKLSAYTNLMMIAGYGAFFALWSITKSDLSTIPATIAVILLVISVTTFVLFEVYKMVISANSMNELAVVLQDQTSLSPKVLQYKLTEFGKRAQRLNVRQIGSWRRVLRFCIVTGLSADLLLLYTFVFHLGTLLAR